MMAEQSLRDLLRQAAVKSYGEQRASELDKRLASIAHWLWLIDQEPLDLLDQEPDHGH